MGFLTNISRKQKRDILYKYFVLRNDIAQIHNEYRDKVSYSYFTRIPTMLTSQPEYSEYCMELLMGKEEYIAYRNKDKPLGHKISSYWDNEDEMIFQDATYKTLSHEERLIFSQAYLEEFLETRNQVE
jgi:hypothetical protein